MAKEKVVKVVVTNSSAAADGFTMLLKLFFYIMAFLIVASILYALFVKVKDFLFGWF